MNQVLRNIVFGASSELVPEALLWNDGGFGVSPCVYYIACCLFDRETPPPPTLQGAAAGRVGAAAPDDGDGNDVHPHHATSPAAYRLALVSISRGTEGQVIRALSLEPQFIKRVTSVKISPSGQLREFCAAPTGHPEEVSAHRRRR